MTATKETETTALIFNKYGTEDVKLVDYSLSKYINLSQKAVPHSFGRKVKRCFQKNDMTIVERLINKIMRSGQGKRKLSGKFIRGRYGCGKKILATGIVKGAFDIIEKQTKQNPIQLLVKAIENSAPREDTTRIQRGGISYTVAVDVAPMRRVDDSLKNIALAAFAQSFNTKTSASEALAKEITLAAKEDSSSFSVKRRDEVERIAKSSR